MWLQTFLWWLDWLRRSKARTLPPQPLQQRTFASKQVSPIWITQHSWRCVDPKPLTLLAEQMDWRTNGKSSANYKWEDSSHQIPTIVHACPRPLLICHIAVQCWSHETACQEPMRSQANFLSFAESGKNGSLARWLTAVSPDWLNAAILPTTSLSCLLFVWPDYLI